MRVHLAFVPAPQRMGPKFLRVSGRMWTPMIGPSAGRTLDQLLFIPVISPASMESMLRICIFIANGHDNLQHGLSRRLAGTAWPTAAPIYIMSQHILRPSLLNVRVYSGSNLLVVLASGRKDCTAGRHSHIHPVSLVFNALTSCCSRGLDFLRSRQSRRCRFINGFSNARERHDVLPTIISCTILSEMEHCA